MDTNFKYAVSAAILFVAYAVSLEYAAPFTRPLLIAAMLLAGIGQFLAQAGTIPAYRMAMVLSYAAMFLALVSLVWYLLKLVIG